MQMLYDVLQATNNIVLMGNQPNAVHNPGLLGSGMYPAATLQEQAVASLPSSTVPVIVHSQKSSGPVS